MNKKILPAMGLALALALGGTSFSALGESSQVAGDIMSSIIGRTEAPPQSGEGEVLDIIQVGYYRYTAEEDGAVIRGWAGSEADVSIPDTLDGLPVVSVGENAFRGNGAIISVALPEGVRRVEAGAFAECAALHAVNVPDSVTFIAGDAFAGSDSVLLVGAAGGYVQTYAQSAGVNMLAVDMVSLPDGGAGELTPLYAPGETFAEGDFDCRVEEDGTVTITGYQGSEQALDVPESLGGCAVARIGEEAFFMNARLQEVALPEGVVEIQSAAFMGCRQLSFINLPATLTAAASDAFMGCPSLVVTAPAGSWAESYARETGLTLQ